MVDTDRIKETAIEYVLQIRLDTKNLEDNIREDEVVKIHEKLQTLNGDIQKLFALLGIIEAEKERYKKP